MQIHATVRTNSASHGEQRTFKRRTIMIAAMGQTHRQRHLVTSAVQPDTHRPVGSSAISNTRRTNLAIEGFEVAGSRLYFCGSTSWSPSKGRKASTGASYALRRHKIRSTDRLAGGTSKFTKYFDLLLIGQCLQGDRRIGLQQLTLINLWADNRVFLVRSGGPVCANDIMHCFPSIGFVCGQYCFQFKLKSLFPARFALFALC